jgi:glycosyltransferase AglD
MKFGMKSRANLRLKSCLPWVVSGLTLWFLLRHFDFSTLWSELHSSSWPFVFYASLLNLILITLFRTERFHVLIANLPGKISFGELGSLLMAVRALNILLPARAGETLRTFQLCKRHHYPMNAVLTSIAMETSLEAIALSMTALVVLATGFFPPSFEKVLYPLVIAGGICASLYLFLGKIKIGRFAARKNVWTKALMWTWLTDFVDLLMVGLCLKAVGISVGATMPLALVHWFLILATINIAIVLPSPGNLGTLEAGAVLSLHTLGVAKGPALAFALLYHAAHLIPVILLGSASLHSQLRNFRRAACSTA